MAQRDKTKGISDSGSSTATRMSNSAQTEVLSPAEMRRALLLDHLHDRIDQLCVRLDAIGSRMDSHQICVDTRMFMIEAELKELPGMIERGMRAALEDEANGM